MKIGIFNNYENLFEKPEPKGLRNIVSYVENTGNIVFIDSIVKETGAISIPIYEFAANKEKYEKEFDVIILSLANMISDEFQIDEQIIEALENTKVPICIFSIGIQANKADELVNMQVPKSALRVLDLSKKSGTTIGLRGDCTKEYLDKIGYKNTQSIGCPSIFLEKVIPQKSQIIERIIINGSFCGEWSKYMERIFYFGIKYGTNYLLQNEASILVDKYNIDELFLNEWITDANRLKHLKNKDYEYKFYTNEFLKLNHLKQTNLTSLELKDWLIKNSIFFTDYETWLKEMKKYQLSIGPRFHGSIMCTQAGVPTLIMVGDLRVQELVEFHSLPFVDIDTEIHKMNPMEIYDLINYNQYESKYDQLFKNYKDFLSKNGIQYCKN